MHSTEISTGLKPPKRSELSLLSLTLITCSLLPANLKYEHWIKSILVD